MALFDSLHLLLLARHFTALCGTLSIENNFFFWVRIQQKCSLSHCFWTILTAFGILVGKRRLSGDQLKCDNLHVNTHLCELAINCYLTTIATATDSTATTNVTDCMVVCECWTNRELPVVYITRPTHTHTNTHI